MPRASSLRFSNPIHHVHPVTPLFDDPSVRVVDSFDALITSAFANDCNALCWKRDLSGNFDEILRGLEPAGGIVPVDEDWLRDADLSPAGRAAARTILEDLRQLREAGPDPEVNVIGA